jgi:hypothetical protein
MNARLLLFLTLMAGAFLAYGQSDSDLPVLRLLDGLESEDEGAPELERIQWLLDHPIDVNAATVRELEQIPMLSTAGAEAIVAHRRTISRFTSTGQLLAIPGIDRGTAERIRPFLFVRQHPVTTPIPVEIRARALQDLRRRIDNKSGSDPGSPEKLYSRVIARASESFEGGILTEKDPGERLRNGFVSGYVAASSWGFIQDAIVGDFRVDAGQGLVLWKGGGYGKGSETTTGPLKRARGVTPYRSSDETSYLRGGAVRSGLGSGATQSSLLLFYAEKATGGERLGGGRLNLAIGDDAAFGITGLGVGLNAADGATRFGGVDGNYRFPGGVETFGEYAQQFGAGSAWVMGTLIPLGQSGAALFLFRDYSPAYGNRHAQGFGERGGTRNERGFYSGIRLDVFSWCDFSAYVDHYQFPEGTPTLKIPSDGYDIMLEAGMEPLKNLDIIARYSRDSGDDLTDRMDSLGRESPVRGEREQDRFRLTGVVQVNRVLRWKGRLEGTQVRNPYQAAENGLMLYQDVQLKTGWGLTVESRFAVFHTSSYETRIYEYENDVRGVFSNPALFGRGKRWYVLFRYQPAAVLAISVKYAETWKDGVETIGSGDAEVIGNRDDRVSAQVDLRW